MEVAGDAKERVVVDDEVDSAPAEDKVKWVYVMVKMYVMINVAGAGYVNAAASYVPKVNIGGPTLNLESAEGIQGYIENTPLRLTGSDLQTFLQIRQSGK